MRSWAWPSTVPSPWVWWFFSGLIHGSSISWTQHAWSCCSSTRVSLESEQLSDTESQGWMVLSSFFPRDLRPSTSNLGCENWTCLYQFLNPSLVCSLEMAGLVLTSRPRSPESLWAGAIFQSSASQKHKRLFRGSVMKCQGKLSGPGFWERKIQTSP